VVGVCEAPGTCRRDVLVLNHLSWLPGLTRTETEEGSEERSGGHNNGTGARARRGESGVGYTGIWTRVSIWLIATASDWARRD
jgi:hypothetical protein